MKRLRWNCRLIVIFVAVCYFSSFSVMMTIVLKNKQFDPLFVYYDNNNVKLLNNRVIERAVHGRNSCVSHLMGIPFSLTKAGCVFKNCENVTCEKLFSGDAKAIAVASNFQRRALSDNAVYELASNCSSLRLLGGYESTPLRATDVDFPIAFNILLHRSAEQFERLLRAVYRPQNIYCVHVDTKSPKPFQTAVKAVINCFYNIFLATNLRHVIYGGLSRLQADIDCMKDHLAQPTQWHYVINMPGQAYPLRTPEEMVDILQTYNGSSDIEGIYRRQYRDRYTNKWEEWISFNDSGIRKTGQKNGPPPHNLTIVRGSAYGVFSRNFVEFVINDRRAKDLLEWSRHTYSPDEHYWATLHHTSYNPHLHTPGGYPGNPDKKEFLAVYAKWSSNRRTKCMGKYIRWVCILGVGDLASLLPRPELFVNKFDIEFQPLALECAERWLQHRVRCPAKIDVNYYSNGQSYATIPTIHNHSQSKVINVTKKLVFDVWTGQSSMVIFAVEFYIQAYVYRKTNHSPDMHSETDQPGSHSRP